MLKTTLAVDDDTCRQMMEYLDLLSHWNKSINLTAIRNPEAMVEKHLLDSLAVLPFIQGGRVLDVGTGAGLPGIPLALADKKTQYTLLDSRGKKLRFLFDVKTRLKMNNIELIENRVEHYKPEDGFDVVVSRAFSSLADFSALAGHCLKDGGRMLAMKATTNEEELRAVKKPYIVAATHQLPVFGGTTHRQLVEIHKNKEPEKVLP
ncbi:MAG TPA: 16S rRNA (guanine(527)-N(7))-methyltransferase RsmG [Pseudomonadales bacterium]